MNELLSPAGSLESAYYAFKAGGDAVYFGLKSFSARKAASNFSKEEVLKLKQLAVSQNKKIYVAINTILKNTEITSLIKNLDFLNDIKVDAVIIQDIGIAKLIKELFPNLVIHASTQMAIHNEFGINLCKELGISRIILPRETTLEKILEFKNSGIEIECFVQGALCYSYSGVCLASGVLLGRSGNRGECAQVCRNYYKLEKQNGYYFSCNDFSLKKNVLELKDAGVVSFKIEGRMKSPEYVYNVTKYYRTLLDTNGNISKEDEEDLRHNMEYSFQRNPTKGFLKNIKGDNLVNKAYSSHTGVFIGNVESSYDNGFIIKTNVSLNIHDGLCFYEGYDLKKQIPFSIKEIYTNDKIKTHKVSKNSKVKIIADFEKLPKIGYEIYKISSSTSHLPKVNIEALDCYKISLNAKATLTNEKIKFEVYFKDLFVSREYEVKIFEAKNKNDFNKILLKVFNEAKDSLYRIDKFVFLNNSSFASDSIFVQPSLLKEIKNSFYDFLNNEISSQNNEALYMSDLSSKIKYNLNFQNNEIFDNVKTFVADRNNINNGEIPFVNISSYDDFKNSFKIQNGFLIGSLPPIIYEDKKIYSYLENLIKENNNKILLGISNVSQINFVRSLNVYGFLDFYFYVANKLTLSLVNSLLNEKLVFTYFYIEDSLNNEESNFKSLINTPGLNIPVIKINEKYNPPLFYSAICFTRHSVLGKCQQDCKRAYKYRLSNMDKNFMVIVQDCVTYVYLCPNK